MELFNQFGDHLHIEDEDWGALLELARARGWKPAGTLAPPRRFGPACETPAPGPWDGSYSPAVGQAVKSTDAERLSSALRAARPDQPASNSRNPSAIANFTAFSSERGFLVCATTDGFSVPGAQKPTEDLLNLSSSLGMPAAPSDRISLDHRNPTVGVPR